jgi:hypothetical protein
MSLKKIIVDNLTCNFFKQQWKGKKKMTLNKKRCFRQKSNAVYTFNLILFQCHKTRNNYFFLISSKKNQNNLKKQVATMEPISTFPSKG